MTAAIEAVQGVEVAQQPTADDDEYESLGIQTLLRGTVEAGPAVAALVTAVHAATTHHASVRQVTLVIDGRTVPLSRLTDEEIEQLLPEIGA